uniref:Transmembrane protein 123 n=1 Tax=Leptobrachium leishanense TaxID=445787 RepID=A0A8C5Q8T1_9ANUR
MRLSGSVRAGLGVALCVLLAATCSAQETNNATKTLMSTVSPNPSNDSIANVNDTTALTVKPESTTVHDVVPTTATTPNKTVTVTATTPNITTALPVNKTTPAATTKATEKPTSANVTSAAATTSSTMTTGSTASAAIKSTKGFDLGSFIGGIVLTLSLLAVAYFGCRFYSSRRGVRYRTIDEHEAII